MKIEEIFVGPERDRFINDKKDRFDKPQPVAKISDFFLKKVARDNTIEYGLLNQNHKLVAYLGLEERQNNRYMVTYTEVVPEIRGHGYGTFLYDYVIMNDQLEILSDTRQTPHAQSLWRKFRTYKKFHVVPYNLLTNKEELDKTEDDVYNSDNLVWLAKGNGETINEALTRINNRHRGASWEVLWYGPFVNNEY